MTAPVCPCGDADAHVMARRRTADGIAVHLWNDGAVVGPFGHKLPGIPIARRAAPEAIRAGWLLMEWIEVYDLDDLAEFYAACRWAADRGLDSAAARARMAEQELPRIRLAWRTDETDWRGNVTSRSCQPGRLMWPGLHVIHERGVYQIWHEHLHAATSALRSSRVLEPSGIKFATQRELVAHLRRLRPGATYGAS